MLGRGEEKRHTRILSLLLEKETESSYSKMSRTLSPPVPCLSVTILPRYIM